MTAIATQTINLDLRPHFNRQNNCIVYCSQYDNDLRNVVVNIADAGTAVNVSTYTIYIEGTKPDKKGFSYELTDIGGTVSNNVVTFPLQLQMTACAGITNAELVFYSGDDRIGSANFILAVEKAGLADDIDVSDTDIPAYVDGAQQAAQAAEDAKDAAVDAKDTAVAVAASIPADYTTLSNDVDDLKSAFTPNTSVVEKVPEGPLTISTALATNATYDSETKTLTIPANKQCSGASIRYRYTAQMDDMGKTIRFVLSINQTVVNPNYIRPIVMWNYAEVTTQSYVSITQDDNTYTFDITIPNDRKNLDIGIFYLYGGTVGSDQTIQFVNLDYYFLDSVYTKYIFASNFKGCKLAPFGDSYTSQGKWQPFVKAFLGLGEVTGWAQYGGTLTSVYEQISTIPTDSDIAVVWIGTNDYSNNRKVGSLLDDVTDESIKDAWGYTTFCAALNYVCNWLSTNLKGKTIVFITPTQRFDTTVVNFDNTNGRNEKGQVINNAGFALEQYAEAMKEVANYWGYPVLDMYHESGINKNSYSAYYQSDALHPSQDGAQLLAQKIAEFINVQI